MRTKKRHVQKSNWVFSLSVELKESKAVPFKLKVFFYCLRIARWVF